MKTFSSCLRVLLPVLSLCWTILAAQAYVSPWVHGIVIEITEVKGDLVFVRVTNHGNSLAILNDPKLSGFNFEIREQQSMRSFSTRYRGEGEGSHMVSLLKLAPGQKVDLTFDLQYWGFPEEAPASLVNCDLRVWYLADGVKPSKTIWSGPFVSDWIRSPKIAIKQSWKDFLVSPPKK